MKRMLYAFILLVSIFGTAAIYFVARSFVRPQTGWPFGFMAVSCAFMFLVGAAFQPTCVTYIEFQSGFPAYGSLLVGMRTFVVYIRRERDRDWIFYLVLLITPPLWAFYLQRFCERVLRAYQI
jgi:hypothetical protein